MAEKLTQEQFIERAVLKHGDRFDYSKVVFQGTSKKITITCRACSREFAQVAFSHLSGFGCRACSAKEYGASRAITMAEFIERATKVHSSKYDYSSVRPFASGKKKVEIICPLPGHGVFPQTVSDHLAGMGCRECANDKNRQIRTSQEEYITKAKATHGDYYDYSEAEFTGVVNPITIICPEHGRFTQKAYQHLENGCKKCGHVKAKASRRETRNKVDNLYALFDKNEIIEKAINVHGDRFDYSLLEDGIQVLDVIKIICKDHGVFNQTVRDHLKGVKCKRCSSHENSLINKVTPEEFFERAAWRHNDKFDYSKTKFDGMTKRITVTCPEHGDLHLKAVQHLYYDCLECSNKIKGQWKKLDTETFISRAVEVHSGKYDYSKVTYTGSQNKVCIICPTHGEFRQQPDDHMAGHGCQKCSGEMNGIKQYGSLRVSYDEFLRRANEIHHGKYTYIKSTFGHRDQPMTIICPEHGEFQQNRNNHIFLKHGCQECGYKKRRSQNEWLDHMEVFDREVIMMIDGRKIQADGYDPETNTIYEFNGDFWHGNPDVYKDMDAINKVTKTTFCELYEKTLRKRDLILNAGYNLVEIWENDWNNVKATTKINIHPETPRKTNKARTNSNLS